LRDLAGRGTSMTGSGQTRRVQSLLQGTISDGSPVSPGRPSGDGLEDVKAHRRAVYGPPVRSCVEPRLACSAGDKPAGAKVRRPVVWIAGWRETKTLKPIDKVSLGETTSRRAVMKVNAYVASKVLAPKAEPATGGRRQHGEPKSDRSGSFTSAGVEATARRQGHAEQLEKPSSPRREIAGAGSVV
jgi:hypothetical protein